MQKANQSKMSFTNNDSIKLIVINDVGLHARPAALFVQTAQNFRAEITVRYGEQKGNAKSLLAILGLGIGRGAEIYVEATGPDSQLALKALKKLVEGKVDDTTRKFIIDMLKRIILENAMLTVYKKDVIKRAPMDINEDIVKRFEYLAPALEKEIYDKYKDSFSEYIAGIWSIAIFIDITAQEDIQDISHVNFCLVIILCRRYWN